MSPEEKVVTEPTPEDKEPATTTEPESKPEGYQETAEDVEKSRAFHQQKAQEEAQRREATQAALDEAERKLDSFKTDDVYPVIPPDEEEAPATPTISDDDDEPITRSQIPQIVNGVVQQLERREQKKETKRLQDQWQAEYDNADAAIVEVAQAMKMERQELKPFLDEATSYIPNINQIGAPKRYAKLVVKLLRQHQAKESSSQRASEQEANERAQVEHANTVVQPPGAATAPPAPTTLEKQMQEEADSIAEDDPPVE